MYQDQNMLWHTFVDANNQSKDPEVQTAITRIQQDLQKTHMQTGKLRQLTADGHYGKTIKEMWQVYVSANED